MNKAKVAVVILNYKLKNEVVKAVNSVLASHYRPLDIIVVDNNSGDGIAEAIKEFKGVLFVQTGANLGYSGGNNQGIAVAIERLADLVFVLNPDAVVKPDTIDKLVQAFNDPRVGMAGPKIYFTDKDNTLWYAGGIFDQANVLGKHRGVDQVDTGKYDTIQETDFVTGAAVMIRRQVLEKVGWFDERYFLYYEDADLSKRVQQAGFKTMYVPSSVAYHANARATGLGSPLQDYFITRNRMLYASKFLGWRTQFALFREALRNLGSLTRRRALIDFLCHNLGKGSFIK